MTENTTKNWSEIRPTEDHYFTQCGIRIPNIVLRMYQRDFEPKTVTIHALATPATTDSWRLIEFKKAARKATADDFAHNGKRKSRYRFLVESRSGLVLCELDRTVPSGQMRRLLQAGVVYTRPINKVGRERPQEHPQQPEQQKEPARPELF